LEGKFKKISHECREFVTKMTFLSIKPQGDLIIHSLKALGSLIKNLIAIEKG
jgi:hypothetical protein